jgi:hypothetical protein
MRDIYVKVLSPAGLIKYWERLWAGDEQIDALAAVQVSRDTLNEGEETFSLIAEAQSQLYPKDTAREAGGAAGAPATASVCTT